MNYEALESKEVNALLAFKAANVDPTGAMASWVVPRTNTLNATKGRGATGAVGNGSLSFLSAWAGVHVGPADEQRHGSSAEQHQGDAVPVG